MNAKSIRKSLFVSLVAVVLLAAFGIVNKFGAPAKADNVLDLQAPSFVNPTDVKESNLLSPTSFLEDEAGIAAYTFISQTIDLSIVRDEFRTIERETDQYIIGSVGTPDYSEDHDPHVYVHTDGWVLAYYLNSEPASYIIDLRHYDGVEIGTTKLEDAMYKILGAVGVVSFDVTCYDFRYPNATHIMLIAEAIYDKGDESFDIHLPSSFTYYDRSWSHTFYGASWADESTLYLDDTLVSFLEGDSPQWQFAHGSFTTAQLPPDISHTIKIDLDDSTAFAGMALVYQEVP